MPTSSGSVFTVYASVLARAFQNAPTLLQNAKRRTQSGIVLTAFAAFFAVGSASAASDIKNACTIFQERSVWHKAANAASQKWQVPVPIILAVMYQESRFKALAAAEKSSAYGFAQALDGTWGWYKKAVKASTAKRTSFADSADFIAWYMVQTKNRVGLPLRDIAHHYIAYHEGHVGYKSSRWAKKPGLLAVSQKVARMAAMYEKQLRSCGLLQSADARDASGAMPRPIAKPFALSEVAAVMPRRKPIDALIAEADIGSATGLDAIVIR
jgi:hypothetical protein